MSVAGRQGARERSYYMNTYREQEGYGPLICMRMVLVYVNIFEVDRFVDKAWSTSLIYRVGGVW